MKILTVLIVLAVLPLNSTALAQQQRNRQKALERDIRELKQGQIDIQKELQEIRRLLQSTGAQVPAAPQNIVLDVEGLPFKGEPTAKLTIVEFSDFQCPYCGRHFREVFPLIEKDYVQTGKIKYVFSPLPLESIHPEAFKAAQAAYCAGDQGKYWEMHGRLLDNQRALSVREQSLHAQLIGLNLPTFQQCLFSEKYAITIRERIAIANSAGIEATPAFLLGFTNPTNPQVRVVKVISGAQPYSVFKDSIDRLLSLPKY